MRDVAGVPTVDFGGQGGLGDVVAAPDFASSRMVYLSRVEAGGSCTCGAVVGTCPAR
ncbi:MAG: PQQ-dependent sugar dehydrogenase [Burkholderiales bacterium]